MVIAKVFPKLQTVKILVRPLSKKSVSENAFDSQHLKESQILAVASILFEIGRISHLEFKCSYLKIEDDFLNFLLLFWNLCQILNILNETMMAIANVFPKI